MIFLWTKNAPFNKYFQRMLHTKANVQYHDLPIKGAPHNKGAPYIRNPMLS